jgi:autotransporter-associated beta strand protein
MPTRTKAATGTVLTNGTSWTGGVAPGSGDIARWISTSLGGTLTGNLTISGIQMEGATAITVLSGAITVGVDGISQTSTNNRRLDFSGTLDVGSSPAAWNMYNSLANTTAGGQSINILSTGNLSGSGTLNLNRTTGAEVEQFLVARTITLFTGTININDGTAIVLNAATTGFTNATQPTIVLNGGNLAARVNTTFTCPISITASSKIGLSTDANGTFSTGSNITFGAGAYNLTTQVAGVTLSGTLDLTSGNHSITTNASTTLSGTINLGSSGVSNTLNSGTGNLTVSGTLNAGTGSHTIGTTSTGTLTISGSTDLSSGSHTFTSVGDITTISGSLTGSNGITITGTSSSNSVYTNITGSQRTGMLGTITINSGTLVVGTVSAANDNMLPNITGFNINAATAILEYRTNTSYTFDRPLSGNGKFRIRSHGSANPLTTITEGILSSPSFTGSLLLYGTSDTTAPYVYTDVAISDFPSAITFDLNPGSISGVSIARFNYNKAASTTTSSAISINQNNDTGQSQAHIINSQASSSHNLKLTSNIPATNGAGGVIAGGTYIYFSGTNTGDNEASGIISGLSRLYKQGTGKWIISGANTFPGSASIQEGGTLVVKTSSALGVPNNSADDLNITENSILELDGSSSNITITNTIANSFIDGTLRSSAGDNTFNSSAQNNGTIIYDVTAGSLTVSNNITGSSARIIEKIGNSTLKLTRAAGAGYLGLFYIYSGEVQVTLLANSGAASSLGTQASAQSSILLGDTTGVTHPSGAAGSSSSATLTHIGTTADSTNRNIVCRADSGLDITINSSGTGSGSLNLTSGGTISFTTAGNHSINFGGTNSATNICDRTIPDTVGSGVVSISKAGSNTWTISGAVSATGSLSCSAGTINLTNATLSCASMDCSGGTINLDGFNRSFSGGFTISSGTISINSGNTISFSTASSMSGGTISGVLSSSSTLSVTSGSIEAAPATLNCNDATNGNNSLSGSVSISGCIDLVTPTALDTKVANKGRVLGTASVTVSNTGIIRTKHSISSAQEGRARYTDLTLQNGSKIKIGMAA